MANNYFNHVNNRVEGGSRALDSQINNIADEIALGFDKLPTEVQLKESTTGFGVSTGSADILVVSLSYVPTLTDGFVFFVRMNATNTGPATIDINGTGVKSIVNSDGGALAAGSLVAGTIAQLSYDLTNDRYILMSNNVTDPPPTPGTDPFWEEITGSPFALTATRTFDIVWDESKYSVIHMVIEGLKPDDNAAEFGFRLGNNNSPIIWAGASDYRNNSFDFNGGGFVYAAANHIPITTDWGDTADQMGGEIHITGVNTISSSFFEADLSWRDSLNVQAGIHVKTMIFQRSIVDTLQFYLINPAHTFRAEGIIQVYGLIK